MNLCDIREVKALLSRHGFHFSKSLGQNFLIADWVPRDIAAAGGGDKACGVLEIGPGIGCLTRELCGRAAKVVSVELDPALPPVLAETMADAENFTLISGDVLQLDIPRLVDGHFQGLTPLVCANLPYNAATPILGALVEAKRFEAITVMVQREAALRLAAKPGTGDYGALSVYMQYHTQPEILFDVPPECFLPAPKVTSSVIRCQVRREPAVHPACGEEFFFRTVKGAFALRRKTLCNSLCTAFGSQLGKGGIAEVISQCGLPPAVRGEALGLEEFAVLADGLYEMIQRL
ncbi:MAG: ribosomal RNA small subunit methyltransferase A [Oscillospiraceae bacterium]|jgi:16S rRNA (adenine1518-N6/adenine1519-N6)-dimethyltransferase|nr:ribosomal RNA small subunit methyltransferase A [Oscillospiraceae bacterium]